MAATGPYFHICGLHEHIYLYDGCRTDNEAFQGDLDRGEVLGESPSTSDSRKTQVVASRPI